MKNEQSDTVKNLFFPGRGIVGYYTSDRVIVKVDVDGEITERTTSEFNVGIRHYVNATVYERDAHMRLFLGNPHVAPYSFLEGLYMQGRGKIILTCDGDFLPYDYTACYETM